MSNSSDYTITTVSSSVFQHSTSNGQPAPFSILPFRSQYRESGFPYVAGPSTALDWNLGVPVSQSAASGVVADTMAISYSASETKSSIITKINEKVMTVEEARVYISENSVAWNGPDPELNP